MLKINIWKILVICNILLGAVYYAGEVTGPDIINIYLKFVDIFSVNFSCTLIRL